MFHHAKKIDGWMPREVSTGRTVDFSAHPGKLPKNHCVLEEIADVHDFSPYRIPFQFNRLRKNGMA